MKQITLPVFVVLTMIALDLSLSIAYANNKTTIFKVAKVSPSGKLQLRAWPSTKSRVKVSLPYNAKDLLETGKQRDIGKSRWVQVKWQDNIGWVNNRYLKKTGVLLSQNKAVASRNNKTTAPAPSATIAKNATPAKVTTQNPVIADTRSNPVIQPETNTNAVPLPNEYQGDRYDQTLKPNQLTVASKTAYSSRQPSNRQKADSSSWVLNCAGSTPQNWKIKMDVAAQKMFVKLADSKEFNIPITYRKWAPGGQVRMEIGGGKGRNLVDATLEKTFACNNGLSKTNYSYMVNAAVNRGELLSGCCNPAVK